MVYGGYDIMKHFKNFKLYNPGDEYSHLKEFNVAFLMSDCGTDWYSAMKEYSDNTTKIVYDENGLIVLQSDDATSLWPNGWSVVEIEKTSENLIGKVYNKTSGKIKDYTKSTDELKYEIDVEIKKLKSEVLPVIQTLQFAVDLQDATQDDINYLMTLKRYVVDLSNIPEQKGYPKSVEYPSIPKRKK